MGSTSQPPLRICVLECDTPLPNTGAKFGGYGGVFENLLTQGARLVGYPTELLTVKSYDVVNKMEYPGSLDEFDAILLTGSKHNSFEDPPWNVKLIEYTRQVLTTQTRVRVIGVCYGHQVIGRALDAVAARNEKGWEVSVCTMNLTPKGKELFGKDEVSIQQMHRDIVQDLPKVEGIESLGYSPVCSQQGMYIPDRLITVQGHPEFTEEIMREIIQSRHDLGVFNDEQANEAMGRVAKPHDGVSIGGVFIKFLLEGR